MQRIGVVSDTHGLLRPEAVAALHGSDLIIHAGDIGASVLEGLRRLAPVAAVRGNNDREAWAAGIPETVRLQVEEVAIQVVHELAALDAGALAGVRVVVSGHSHRPSVERRGDVLYLNPGSAGPRRFRLPVALAHLVVDGASAQARIAELRVETGPPPRRSGKIASGRG